jgi:hypothetical protein
MVFKTLRKFAPAGLSLVLPALGCHGSNLTLPSDASPANLTGISGGGQRGTVGKELPQPLIVQVTDQAGRPVKQVGLRFGTQVPAAEVVPAEVVTDTAGRAEVRVKLGTVEGIQSFEAELADAADLRTRFEVIAVADQPADNGGGRGGGGGGDGNGGGGPHGGGGGNGDGHGSGHHHDHGGNGHGHGHGGDDHDGHGHGDDN